MRLHVIDPAGTNLPNGRYAPPGTILDAEASGISEAVAERLIAKGVVERVDAQQKQRVTTDATANIRKGG